MLLYRIVGVIRENLCKNKNDKNAVAEMIHPSARISYENLVKQMRLEQFNPKLKKEEPVYVSKFECK